MDIPGHAFVVLLFSFLSSWSRTMSDDGQTRNDLQANNQQVLDFHPGKAACRHPTQGLFHTLLGFCQQLGALLLIGERLLTEFIGLRLGHLIVIALVFLDVFHVPIIELGRLGIILPVNGQKFAASSVLRTSKAPMSSAFGCRTSLHINSI